MGNGVNLEWTNCNSVLFALLLTMGFTNSSPSIILGLRVRGFDFTESKMELILIRASWVIGFVTNASSASTPGAALLARP